MPMGLDLRVGAWVARAGRVFSAKERLWRAIWAIFGPIFEQFGAQKCAQKWAPSLNFGQLAACPKQRR